MISARHPDALHRESNRIPGSDRVHCLLHPSGARDERQGAAGRGHGQGQGAPPDPVVEWFQVSPEVAYHPGHAWARAERPGLVTVGMDDFAQKLVGPIAEVSLPHVGARVSAGRAGVERPSRRPVGVDALAD